MWLRGKREDAAPYCLCKVTHTRLIGFSSVIFQVRRIHHGSHFLQQLLHGASKWANALNLQGWRVEVQC